MDDSKILKRREDTQKRDSSLTDATQQVKSFTPPPTGIDPIPVQKSSNPIQLMQELPVEDRPDYFKPNYIQQLQILPEEQMPERFQPDLIQRIQRNKVEENGKVIQKTEDTEEENKELKNNTVDSTEYKNPVDSSLSDLIDIDSIQGEVTKEDIDSLLIENNSSVLNLDTLKTQKSDLKNPATSFVKEKTIPVESSSPNNDKKENIQEYFKNNPEKLKRYFNLLLKKRNYELSLTEQIEFNALHHTIKLLKENKDSKEEDVSAKVNRIDIAKQYEKKFKYSLGREPGTTNCADFVTMIMMQTDKNIAEKFITEKNTLYSNVAAIRNAIINELGGKIRVDNPQKGDIAIWWNPKTQKGHVEFVSSVFEKNGKNYFTTFGAGSGTVPREMGISYNGQYCKNGCPWLHIDYPDIGSLGQGGVFEGFWTPHSKK